VIVTAWQNGRWQARKWYVPVVAVPLVGALVQLGAPAALASATVNVTIHIPSTVANNACAGDDPINLNGDMHIVITTTADRQGGYHVTNHRNTHLTGTSLTTGARYVSNNASNDEWYARGPFPAVQTWTDTSVLVGQGSTPNAVARITAHETVDGTGATTASTDSYTVDCHG
jgi:hypothetical protein